jgi:NADH-quinone oxidoreductase subunit L
MRELIWAIPAAPLAGFALLALARGWPRRAAAGVGIASVAVSAGLAIAEAVAMLAPSQPPVAMTQTLWQWMDAGGFRGMISLRLDALSLVMILVVTVVGLLIHVYSAAYMGKSARENYSRGVRAAPNERGKEGERGISGADMSSEHDEAPRSSPQAEVRESFHARSEDEGIGRFFACMNLFVGSMLILVLAGDLLLLYLGWEGVGLCSYLLIGFWHRDRSNARAAMKAFIVTRIGDAALAVGLFILFLGLGTPDIQELQRLAAGRWAGNPTAPLVAACLLLAGAVGKSAQLPLQTWLPDAMAGPTPVSALIHAATMVAAGVYLIARMHGIFDLAPAAMDAAAVIGAATLLVAGASALVQHDIKRVLAYSTISQLGYMFLALGVGAYSAAIFHFFTHAFFKSLLFLSAGAVILALRHEQDLRRMGGLRKRMPLVFWTFLIGAASLSALPLVTAGFYSKDMILASAWRSPRGGHWLWAAGLIGAFLTAIYAFRAVFLVFFGRPRGARQGPPGDEKLAGETRAAGPISASLAEPLEPTPRTMAVPLAILAAMSLVAGFVQLPAEWGGAPLFTNFLGAVFPRGEREAGGAEYMLLQAAPPIAALGGVLIAWILFLRAPAGMAGVLRAPAADAMRRFFLAGWGFDWLYDRVFVRPIAWLASANRRDFVDLAPRSAAWASVALHRLLARTQNGRVRWYAAWLAAGVIALVASLVWR